MPGSYSQGRGIVQPATFFVPPSYPTPAQQEPLAGAAVGVGAATGALSVQHNLVSGPVGVGAAAGALSVTHRLQTAPTGVGVAGGVLSVTHRLAAAGTGVGAATGALTVVAQVQLSAGAVGVGGASGALSLKHLLAVTVVGVGKATADMSGGTLVVDDGTGTGWYRRRPVELPRTQPAPIRLAARAVGVSLVTAALSVWSPTYTAEELNALSSLVDEDELAVLMTI